MSLDHQRTRLLTAFLAIVTGVVAWAVAQAVLPTTERTDVTLYRGYADRVFAGEMPYRDVTIEYPPGALVAILLPRLAGSAHYVGAFSVLMAVCGLVLVLATDRLLERLGLSLRRRLATVAGLAAAPLVLGGITFERYDLLPACLVALALLAMVDGRWTPAGVLLGLGTVAKVYPAVLLPVLAVVAFRAAGRRAALRALLACLAPVAGVFLGMLALTGTGALHSLRVQLDRPLQIESTGAALLHVAHQLFGLSLGTEFSYGSTNLGGSGPAVVAALFAVASLAGLAAVTWLTLRARGGRETVVLAVAAMLAVAVVLGKVLSPQYLLWLVPAALLLPGARGVAAAVLTAVAAVLTNALYPGLYPDLEALAPGASWLLVARDGLLCALAGGLVVLLWRAGTVREPRLLPQRGAARHVPVVLGHRPGRPAE